MTAMNIVLTFAVLYILSLFTFLKRNPKYIQMPLTHENSLTNDGFRDNLHGPVLGCDNGVSMID